MKRALVTRLQVGWCGLLLSAVLALGGTPSGAAATESTGASPVPLAHIPPHLEQIYDRPLTLLGVLADDALFQPAWSYLPYVDTRQHEGYFLSGRCYAYNLERRRFEVVTDRPSIHSPAGPGPDCGGHWSGDLLNWASTSRVDLLRSFLDGGARTTDLDGQVVLRSSVAAPANMAAAIRAGVVWRATPGRRDSARWTPFPAAAAVVFCRVTEAGLAMLRVSPLVAAPAQAYRPDCGQMDALPAMALNVLVCSDSPSGASTAGPCHPDVSGRSAPMGLLQALETVGPHDFVLLKGLPAAVPSSAEVSAPAHNSLSAAQFSELSIEAMHEDGAGVSRQLDALQPAGTVPEPYLALGQILLHGARLLAEGSVDGAAGAVAAGAPLAAPAIVTASSSLTATLEVARSGRAECRSMHAVLFGSGVATGNHSSAVASPHSSLRGLPANLDFVRDSIVRLGQAERLPAEIIDGPGYQLAGLAYHMRRLGLITALADPYASVTSGAHERPLKTLGVHLGSAAQRIDEVGGETADALDLVNRYGAYRLSPGDNGVRVEAGPAGLLQLRGMMRPPSRLGTSAMIPLDSQGSVTAMWIAAEHNGSGRPGGDLKAFRAAPLGQNSFVLGSAENSSPGADAVDPVWSAQRMLTSAQQRATAPIFTSRPDGATVPLRWENLAVEQRVLLDRHPVSGLADGLGAARVAWLRGEPGAETVGTTPVASVLRARPEGTLGAMVNSTPWVMYAPAAGWSSSEAPGYPQFRASLLSRPVVAFAGAEDGMLHAFRVADGAPLLSYIPRALLPRLGALTLPHAASQPQVDGSPFVGDVRRADGQWRSMAFVTFGRGGQGVVALDVTRLGLATGNGGAAVGMTAATPPSSWEFTDRDDADLGHILSRPIEDGLTGQPRQLVQMANGRWAVLLGNGYDSARVDGAQGSGAAVLFALFIDGPSGPGTQWLAGRDYVKIAVGTAGAGPDNGLGAPFPVDTDGDGRIDAAYAGDLHGNVWKFDLSTPDPQSWEVAFSGRPFYVAQAPAEERARAASKPARNLASSQPIQAAVLARPHPLGGMMVNFGSGKSLRAHDLDDPGIHSIYGVWDRPAATAPPAAGRGRLLQQSAARAPGGRGLFSSAHRINDWELFDGWVLDLPLARESVLDNPTYRESAAGPLLSVLARFWDPAMNESACLSPWHASVWQLDALHGAQPASLHTFDANFDGRFDAGDWGLNEFGQLQAYSGLIVPGAIDGTRFPQGQLIRQAARGQPLRLLEAPLQNRSGRVAWREIDDPD